MAKNDDDNGSDGSSGNSRYYYDPSLKKWIRSGKGGPTKEQFRTSPSFARTRERTNEFGGAGKWASEVKGSLSVIGHLAHARWFNKLSSAGYYIQQKDELNELGHRTIAISNNPLQLFDIEFNIDHPFRSVIRVSHQVSLSPDKKTVTMNIPEFVTSRDAHWGNKFYAVRIYLVIAQQADVAWNPDIKDYAPVVPDLDLLTRYSVSDWMVRNSVPVDVNLEASFVKPALTMPGSSVLVAMGVEFATTTYMGQPYVTPRCGSMAIVECYSA